MYGRTFIFVENFYVNNLSVVLENFHVFNLGYPRKLFNLEHFPIYGNCNSNFKSHNIQAKMWTDRQTALYT